jgi:hydrogenase/urease accessory protein HupE
MIRILLGLVLLSVSFPVQPVAAHDVDVTSVARVFLDEVGESRYNLSVVDVQVPPIRDPSAVIPEHCRPLAANSPEALVVAGFAFECERPLTFEDRLVLPWSLAGVVVLARWVDGSEASSYFRGDAGVVEVPLAQLDAEAGSVGRLLGSYFVLGAEHILLGIDHLLFVLGLLLLVRGAWPLVKTITAFTVAHSVTLGMAVLGIVPVQSGPVEAAIALSIVLLAREIVMGERGRTSLVHSRPWIVAFAFGLLHGLGFAGALGEIGLRSADVPLALLSFNLGVEAGQLAFVGVLLLVYRLVGTAVRARIPQLEPALGYALGALATLWFIDRLPAVWGA